MTDVGTAMPGFGEVDFATVPTVEDDWTLEQWEMEYQRTGDRLRSFLASRDPWAVLARTASRHIMEDTMRPVGPETDPEPGYLPFLIQPDVELLQALILHLDIATSRTPTSPNNFVRFWPLLGRQTRAFLGKMERPAGSTDAAAGVARRARALTVYYRNLFERGDCERVVDEILRRVDPISSKELGYPLSELWRAMIFVINTVTARLDEFGAKLRVLDSTADVETILGLVGWFRNSYPLAARAWRSADRRMSDLATLKYAAFQLSELAHPWIYTIGRADLLPHFSPKVVAALFDLALEPGALKDATPEHFHLQNPVWRNPYVRLGNEPSTFTPAAARRARAAVSAAGENSPGKRSTIASAVSSGVP
jgi:hypothetical protein